MKVIYKPLFSSIIIFLILGFPVRILGMEIFDRPDYADARKFYTRCIHSKGPEDKGVIYWSGHSGAQSEAQMQYMLGDIFYYGKGVEQDVDIAAYWFDKSANQNDYWAKYMLKCFIPAYRIMVFDYNLIEYDSYIRKCDNYVRKYYDSCPVPSLPTSTSSSTSTPPSTSTSLFENLSNFLKDAAWFRSSKIERTYENSQQLVYEYRFQVKESHTLCSSSSPLIDHSSDAAQSKKCDRQIFKLQSPHITQERYELGMKHYNERNFTEAKVLF